MEPSFTSTLFRPRPSSDTPKREGKKACACRRVGGPDDECGDIGYVSAGMECPFCGFGTLREIEPGKIVCPVCGYGTNRPVT